MHAGGPAAPTWSVGDTASYEADPVPQVRERYAEVRELTASRSGARARPAAGDLVTRGTAG